MQETLQESEEQPITTLDEYEKHNLKTHYRVTGDLSGRVVELKPGFAKVSLITTNEMTADDKKLVHSGFLISSAIFCAMASVNDPYVTPLNANVKFLSPVKVGDIVIFEAIEKIQKGKRREIIVTGMLNNIKILTVELVALVFEEHILTNKLPQYK